jgi:membrane associated rhomboid family serine protease
MWKPPVENLAKEVPRGVPTTVAIVAAILAVSTAAWIGFGQPLTPTTSHLAGGRSDLAMYAGQTWRLLSAGLLHRDLEHLAWNLVPALPFLVLLELRHGSIMVLALTLWSLLIGHLTGHWIQGGASVGFSPAVFGLIAAFLVAGPRRTRLWWLSLAYSSLAMAASFRLPGVDAGAHVGGFLAGALFAATAGFQPPRRHVLLTALAVTTVVILGPIRSAPVAPWDAAGQGVRLDLASNWSAPNPGERCAPDLPICLTVTTQTMARRRALDFRPLAGDQSITLPQTREAAIGSRAAGASCVLWRRGLYHQQICAHGGLALADVAAQILKQVLPSLKLHSPSDLPEHPTALTQGIAHHRLGDLKAARSAYAAARRAQPEDAKVPFLQAILEVDFGGDRSLAERRAREAVDLDPNHPAGRALLEELQR